MPKRVIIDKPVPGGKYTVGRNYALPDITADAWIAKGVCHVFGPEDWARQQKREEAASLARAEAKKAKKAEHKAHAAAVTAARPLADAQDAAEATRARLRSAEGRLADADGKKAKEWGKTVKGLKAELKAAEAVVAKLEPAADSPSAPDPKIEVND